MPPATVAIDLLGRDVVAIAQCIAIDADVFPYPSADFTARSWRDRTWIAREPDRGRVVGFLAARAHRGVLHVQGLAVDGAERRRGIGRALLRACLQSDLASAAEAVALSVSVLNRGAIALYQDEGFVVARRLRDHYPARAYGAERDAFSMRREADAGRTSIS
jgi:ribosomal protein S18 acetylase RimI-like enzyme